MVQKQIVGCQIFHFINEQLKINFHFIFQIIIYLKSHPLRSTVTSKKKRYRGNGK